MIPNDLCVFQRLVMNRFRLLEPEDFCRSHLAKGIHTDGQRPLSQCRSVSYQTGIISSAHGSAMVKQGNTTVVASIKAELCEPPLLEPDRGMLSVNIETSNQVSEAQQEQITQTQAALVDLIARNLLIDVKSLCIKPRKTCWILYCDLVCLELDGAIFDVCCLAFSAALANTLLPQVNLDPDSKPSINTEIRKPLKTVSLPLASTFTFYKSDSGEMSVVADPNQEELSVLPGALTVVLGGIDQVFGVHRVGADRGDAPVLDSSTLDQCVRLATDTQRDRRKTLPASI